MLSIILKYNTKNFLKSFVFVLLFFLFFSFVIELIFIKKNLIVKTTFEDQYEYLFLKVCILVNKLFPFIVFCSGGVWIFRLKKLRTWSIFQCSGASILQVLKGPVLAVILMSMFELFYWGPWCQNMMEKVWIIQKKENYWMQPKARWKFFQTPEKVSYIFYMPGEHIELFSFNKDFILKNYLCAEKFSISSNSLHLQHIWSMPIDQYPKFLKTLIVKFPLFLPGHTPKKHPFLMSFLELSALSRNTFLSQTILLRRQYFLSNTVWFCLLLPFSSAILSGYHRSVYRYIPKIFFGSMICFVLFLAKEWSCIISYSMTGHALSYLITWLVPLLTAFLTLVLWITHSEL
ncbi:putative permease [Holospora obtusa F1]|uniref:Permease n=1 Tax=Holospora obtusa F1 TaxID=1399147 RepID=W6TDR4_HOLOB|nr:LptF/LptG family permease [Holospora obtusa]ETZ06916.1 putative permease [Holospora obtusa F1]